MKYLAMFSLIISTFGLESFALTMDDINSNVIISKSRGPSYKDAISVHALEYWENNEDFNNLFDDGMNHHALDQCDLKEAYSILDMEIAYDEWPELSVRFKSIKKTKGSRTFAYMVIPVATYTINFLYYKTRSDDENDKLSEKEVTCPVEYSEYYYYENTKDKSVKLIGTTED
jgi:hypothetical protein